jgi:hypothetical protein
VAIEKGVSFPITAKDEFSSAFTLLKSKVTEAQGNFEKLKGVMQLSVGGLSIVGFGALVQHAMDAADEMGKLSQKTGIAVDQLSKLSYAARLSDVDMETFGKGMKGLNASLVAASDTSSKSAKIFRALGVDVTAGPAKALEQLAARMSTLADGEVKSTLATEIFKKAGQGMIPMLNQGAEGIRKAADEAERLGLVLSEETAKAAEQFNDNVKAIEAGAGSLGRTFVNTYGKGVADATGAIKEALIEGGKLNALWVALGAAGAFIFTDTMLSDAEKFRRKMSEVNEKLAEMRAHMTATQQQRLLENLFNPEVMKNASGFEAIFINLNRQLRLLQELENANKGAYDDQASRAARQGQVLGGGPDKGLEGRLRGILSENDKAKNAAEEITAALEKELAKLSNITGVDKKYDEVVIELTKHKYNLTQAEKDHILAIAAAIDAKKKELETDKFLTEEHQKEIDHAKTQGDLLEELANDWVDLTEKMQDEVDLLGQSDLAREKAILLRKAENDIAKANNDAATIRDINEQLEKQLTLLGQKDAITKSLQVWDELATRGAQFFSDLVQHGHKAFQDLYQDLKSFAAEMVAMFAKRWILQLAASATGSTALSAAAGNVGQGTVAGAAGNYVGGALNTAAGAYLAGGGAGGFTGAFSAGYTANAAYLAGSAEMAPVYGTVAGEMGGAAAGIAEGITSVLAAIPVWGWIALAVIAIAAYFGGKGGGPKVGGSFMGDFDSGGTMTGTSAVPGSDNGRFYTPDQLDKPMESLVRGTATGFFQALRGLGGTTSGFHFGLGADNDPQGTAQSRISGMVTDANGRVVYQVQDRSMDDKEVPAQLQLEAQRMILAALQASDLPKDVANILNTQDAHTATAEQIQNVIGLATAFQNLGDTIAAMEGGPVVGLKQQLVAQ